MASNVCEKQRNHDVCNELPSFSTVGWVVAQEESSFRDLWFESRKIELFSEFLSFSFFFFFFKVRFRILVRFRF